MNEELALAIDTFPWESEDQKKGFSDFINYSRQFGLEPKLPIDPIITYFIQKDHESHLWWEEHIEEFFGQLRDDMMLLRGMIDKQQAQINELLAKNNPKESTPV